MIIYFNEFDKIPNSTYSFLYSLLPTSRKQKVDSLFFEKDKHIKIVEYFLVKKLLKLKLNPDFLYTKGGKPYIDGEKNFNISHSGNMLVVATAKNEIGVDVQQIVDFNPKLARYVLNDGELDRVLKSKDKNLEFTRLWAKKESYIKCNGLTIFNDIKNVLTNLDGFKFKFDYVDNFVICVCTKKIP